MESIEIHFNLEKTKVIYKNYFKFHKNKEFKKIPIKLIYSISLFLILLGIINKIIFLIIFGSIILTSVSIFSLYYLVKLNKAYAKSLEETENGILESNYIFSFDENGIGYESKEVQQKITWDFLSPYFIENGGDIYLYKKSNELHGIISISIIGPDLFEKFKITLIEKGYHQRES